MRTDDTSASLDRDDGGGEESELYRIDDSAAESAERADDPDAEPDDELFEAELGAHDIELADDPGFEVELEADADDDESDIDAELVLLQELGIELEAPDLQFDRADVPSVEPESSGDDEVAA
jgi:hypothetical protein